MLDRVDRVILSVPDRDMAVARWKEFFGVEKVREYDSAALGAKSTVVQAGDTEFEFLEPTGDGPTADYRNEWGQGLLGAGFSTPDLQAMARHLDAEGVTYTEDNGRLFLANSQTIGMPTLISQSESRMPVGDINFVYEVTNPVPDWKAANDLYVRIFGLDESRFSPIESERYGYRGTLTLFNPPERLDRIEITETFGGGAMDRFFHRRGPSLYMCYIDVDDVLALGGRLEAANARFNYSAGRPDGTGLFIHPTSLFGMLMGVSLKDYAWVWSGRPELGGPFAKGDPGTH